MRADAVDSPGLGEDREWRRDVALELWVDVDGDRVRLRVAGMLDASTAPSLLAAVADMLGTAARRFELVTDDLRVEEPAGADALAAALAMVDRHGGTLSMVRGPGARTPAGEGAQPDR
jgi:hypothetical protein